MSSWMDSVNQGIDDAESTGGGGGLLGWATPSLTAGLAPETYFFFRPLPDALAVVSGDFTQGLPLFAANVHMRYGGGMSCFYSPENTFPDPAAPAQSEDPSRAWLKASDVLYKRKTEITEQVFQLRKDMDSTLYILMQCVLYDADMQLIMDGNVPAVRVFAVSNHFYGELGWKRDFEALAAQGINPSDPMQGVIMRGFRSGKQLATRYRSEGPLLQPGAAPYPIAWNADGSPNMPMIQAALAQVKPWHTLFEFVTKSHVDQCVTARAHVLTGAGSPVGAPGGSPAAPPASPPGVMPPNGAKPGAPTPQYNAPPDQPVPGAVPQAVPGAVPQAVPGAMPPGMPPAQPGATTPPGVPPAMPGAALPTPPPGGPPGVALPGYSPGGIASSTPPGSPGAPPLG